jgi:hypothetical protein
LHRNGAFVQDLGLTISYTFMDEPDPVVAPTMTTARFTFERKHALNVTEDFARKFRTAGTVHIRVVREKPKSDEPPPPDPVPVAPAKGAPAKSAPAKGAPPPVEDPTAGKDVVIDHKWDISRLLIGSRKASIRVRGEPWAPLDAEPWYASCQKMALLQVPRDTCRGTHGCSVPSP